MFYYFTILKGLFSHLVLNIILCNKHHYPKENPESQRNGNLKWKMEVKYIGYQVLCLTLNIHKKSLKIYLIFTNIV